MLGPSLERHGSIKLGTTDHALAPSFKLKDKRREGAKFIQRYHVPATPYARTLAHPKVSKVVEKRLRELYRALDRVARLAEMRAAGLVMLSWPHQPALSMIHCSRSSI